MKYRQMITAKNKLPSQFIVDTKYTTFQQTLLSGLEEHETFSKTNEKTKR